MRKILKIYILCLMSLVITGQIAQGIRYGNGTTLLYASFWLALSFYVAKPVINILILPLNLVTFGVFRWISSVICLYLTTIIVPDFKILDFSFPGFTSVYLDIPPFHTTGILALLSFSLLISVILSILHWLFK